MIGNASRRRPARGRAAILEETFDEAFETAMDGAIGANFDDAVAARYPATEAIDALAGMRAIFDVCSDGMALLDGDGCVTLTNRRLEELLQLPAEYLHGKRFAALHADFTRLFGDPNALAAMLRGPSLRRQWTVAQRWPEARQLQCRYCGLPRIGPRAGVLAVQPIAAADNERLRDRFLALTARELRAPLASIAGFADLLISDGAANLTEKQRDYLGLVRDDALHERTVIEDVLELLTLDGGRAVVQRHPVALDLVLRRAALALHQRLTDAEQRLVLDTPSDFPPLVGDTDRLTRAVTGMLAFAQDRAGIGEEIHMRVEHDEQTVRVVVRDDGPELTEEEEQWLHLHLRRAPLIEPPPDGGIPLSLLVAQTIAHLHGGALDVATAEDGGVECILSLPAKPDNLA